MSQRPGRGRAPADSVVRDDPLRLAFTCCHPVPVAGGPGGPQPADAVRAQHGRGGQALLVPEPTMVKRLTRPSRRSRPGSPTGSRPTTSCPTGWPGSRPRSTCCSTRATRPPGATIRSGPTWSTRRCGWAGWLTGLLPDEPAVLGLFASMLLQDARRPARFDDDGLPVLLADQDLRRGNDQAQEGGAGRRGAAGTLGRVDLYVVQAAIAACHALAPSFAATDWDAVVSWYDVLLTVQDTPTPAEPGCRGGRARRPGGRPGRGRSGRRPVRLSPAERRLGRAAAPARPGRGGRRRLPVGAGPRGHPSAATWRPGEGQAARARTNGGSGGTILGGDERAASPRARTAGAEPPPPPVDGPRVVAQPQRPGDRRGMRRRRPLPRGRPGAAADRLHHPRPGQRASADRLRGRLGGDPRRAAGPAGRSGPEPWRETGRLVLGGSLVVLGLVPLLDRPLASAWTSCSGRSQWSPSGSRSCWWGCGDDHRADAGRPGRAAAGRAGARAA